MARQKVAVKVNQFVGGLNTEANPLSFPDGATFSEQNAEMLRNGSRRRRYGFDVEDFYEEVNTGVEVQDGRTLARTQFRWENPGGISGKQFLVVQIGNYLGVHSVDNIPISTTPIFSKVFPESTYERPFGYASVDGVLVVGVGEAAITTLTYKDGVITEDSGELLIRDFFGVADPFGVLDLTATNNVSLRPNYLTQAHIYNLRNQTFAIPRISGTLDSIELKDPIRIFWNALATVPTAGAFWGDMWPIVFPGQPVNPWPLANLYPSNADSVTKFLYADPNMTSNRTVERFNGLNMLQTPPYNSRSAMGHFVINALDRGASRLEQIDRLYSTNPVLQYPVTTLPTDKSSYGANVLTEYAGRVWYAGFSGDNIGGDANSPRLSSYVLFSQVIQSPIQIFNCYQEADPTSNEESDIVDTDGGFIKIDGAFGIKALVPIDTSLFVFAENGVWKITGTDQNGFLATGYSVSKLSDEGCVNGQSVVSTDVAVMHWGLNGIFVTSRDQYGNWSVVNVSESSIQTFYDDIPTTYKTTCNGYFDNVSSSVRWVYGFMGGVEDTNELVLNLKFQAFTKNIIYNFRNALGVLSISGGQRVTTPNTPTVTSNGILVTSNSEEVFITTPVPQRDSNQPFYCVMVSSYPFIKYTFGGYVNTPTVVDWGSFGGIDSPAYLITGFATGGDARLRKDVPYLSTYFEITNDIESSCHVSAQWNWTTDPLAGKYSTPRQAYRPSRTTEGHALAKTRNKIRGFGNSVAFKFESEPNKTFHIYGWEFNLGATSDE